MVVSTGREEGRLVRDSNHDLEAEDTGVEVERPIDVRHLQVDMTDVDARVDAHAGTVASGRPSSEQPAAHFGSR